jgi:tetratricopeptide (TPR) repeat protein
MVRRNLSVLSAAVQLCVVLIIVGSCLTDRATAESGSPVWEAFHRAEQMFMRGDDSGALQGYSDCLELIEKLGAAERQPNLPVAELALRRLYSLSSDTAGYPDARDTFSRWASFDENSPTGAVPELASLARFFAGASVACTEPKVDGAREVWNALGFLDAWWVIGPFDNERGTGFGTSFAPEGDARPSKDVSHAGKNRPVTWRALPVEPITGWVDLDALMRPSDQAVAYAMTFVESDGDHDATLRLGTDEGYRLWHNGRLLASRDVHRRMRFDQDVVSLRLRKGWNSILLKVAEESGRWEFRARLTAPDGSPLTGWKEGLPPEDAEDLPVTPASLALDSTTEKPSEPAQPDYGSAAIRILDERLEKPSPSANDHYVRGVLLQKLGAHDIVEHPDREALERAIELHPDPPPSTYYYYLAEANRRRVGVTADRDYNAWRHALEKSAGLRKSSVLRNDLPAAPEPTETPSLRARVELAEHYLDSFENLIAARAFLETVLEQNPDYTRARLLLGSVESSQGFPRAMKRAYADCRSRQLTSPQLVRHEAERLRKRGEFDAAEELLTTLHDRNRLDGDSRTVLVNLMLERGRHVEALALLERGLIVTPFDSGGRERMVSILRGRGDDERALEIQRQLVQLAPDDHQARRDEGDLLWELDRQEEAFAVWDAALAIQPNFPELREYIDFMRSRRDPFVEEFELDVSELVDTTRKVKVSGDSIAEVLLNRTSIAVHTDGTVKEFHQHLIRVLNDRGVSAYDRYQTYYAAGNQRVEYKKASVVHADGSVERARLREFQGGERDSGNYQRADIDLPPLEVGDIIEIQYVLEDVHQSFFGDYFGRRESFKSTVPIREKTLILRVPGEREFYFHYRNLDVSPTIERDPDNGHVTYTWTVRDIARLDSEPGMPPRTEADPTLEISTFQDWTEFSTWYWSLIRKQHEKSPAIVEKVAELTKDLEAREDRIRALYNFVVQEIRYNAWEFGIHGFKPYNAPTIFARRFGDCKDKATLLSVMLGEAGIEAHPVLINATNSRGQEDLTLPMVNHFNHCITYVPAASKDEKPLFLDGTATHNRLEELPASDGGAAVLVVRPEGSSLEAVPWTDPRNLAVEEDVQIHVRIDGSAEIEIRGRALGDYGALLRSHFEVAGKRKTLLEKIYGRRFAGATVEDEQFSDLKDLGQPVTFRLRLLVPSLLREAPEGLSMQPLDDFFQSNRMLEGLSSLEKREHDIVLGAPRRAKLNITVHLPPGLAVKSVPTNRVFSNVSSRFESRYAVEDGQVQFTRLLELTSPRVTVAAYEKFRELATQLERLREETWIFKESADTSN